MLAENQWETNVKEIVRIMHKRLGIKRFSVIMVLAMTLSVASFSAVSADEYDIQTLEEKLEQLEAELMGLRGLVKALTMDIQAVGDGANIDMEEFQPRLHTVEKISKENAFEVKKLKGSVMELAEHVDALNLLRPEIYQAKNTMKEIKTYFVENAEAFIVNIDENELLIQALSEQLEKTMILISVYQQQIDPVNLRQDSLDERLSVVGSNADAIQAGLEHVATGYNQSAQTIHEHMVALDAQVTQLTDAINQANTVSQFVAEIKVEITEIFARSQETQTSTDKLFEFIQQFERVDGEARQMRNQIEEIGGHLLVLARQAEENSAYIAENSARIDRLQSMTETSTDEPRENRLSQKINEAFFQFEATQSALNDLQQSLANSREEIKRDVLQELPRIPSTDEIIVIIQESAAGQIAEANARANQAQNVALIALVTGLSAIAVSLVL